MTVTPSLWQSCLLHCQLPTMTRACVWNRGYYMAAWRYEIFEFRAANEIPNHFTFFCAAKGSMYYVAIAMVTFSCVKKTWLLFSREDMFSCERSPGISLPFIINCVMWPLRQYFSNHGNNIIVTLFQYLVFLNWFQFASWKVGKKRRKVL